MDEQEIMASLEEEARATLTPEIEEAVRSHMAWIESLEVVSCTDTHPHYGYAFMQGGQWVRCLPYLPEQVGFFDGGA